MSPAAPDLQHALDLIAESIAQRYRHHAGKTLWDVYRLDEHFTNIEGDIPFILAHRAELLAALSDPTHTDALLRLYIDPMIAFTYANNQFIQINEREQQELVRLYRIYLAELRGALADPPDGPPKSAAAVEQDLHQVVTRHFQALRRNITRFFDPVAFQDVRDNLILRRTVCEQYTPEFQLSMLGLRLEDLVEPVLDLGCGASARLVHWLRQQGIDAWGADRLLEAEGQPKPYLIQADWFSLALAPEHWGVVLSHMAFSNHFIFHHLYRYGEPQRYARRYMDILAALRPGGRFVYAPGLPFIEKLLPAAHYTVQTVSAQPDQLTGEPLNAAHVIRTR